MMKFEDENSPTCAHAEQLISVLYGEASEREEREFEVHLKQCAGCRGEFATFAQVRESIGEWRDEALRGFVPAATPVRKSAWGALRQFFSLSPLWMKGAVGFAALIFCVLAVLAVGRWQSTPELPPPVATANPAIYTEQDMQRMVKEALAKQQQEQRAAEPRQVLVFDTAPPRNQNRSSNVPQSRRPFSRAERDQLAAELRLLSTSDENDLESPDQ